ncbi:MAG TPA: hypothetical protein VF188_06550 [Longimicrobiales bacterium]
MKALLDGVADTPVSVEEAAAAFRGARRELIERHLETLEIMGEVARDGDGRFHAGAAGSRSRAAPSVGAPAE